MCKNRVDSLKV